MFNVSPGVIASSSGSWGTNVIRTSAGTSGTGVDGTVDTLAESILGALLASGMLMWDWLGEGAVGEGAMGETGLYGIGGLRAIFRTAGRGFSCSFPPSFDI